MTLCIGQLGGEIEDIPLVDIGREAGGEGGLVRAEVIEVVGTESADEILPNEVLTIGQKGALLLAREGGELVGGLLHGADVAFPGVAHDANEKVEEKTLPLVLPHDAFGGEQIAMGQVGRVASVVGG